MHVLRFSAMAAALLGGAYLTALADAPRALPTPKATIAPLSVMSFGKENASCAEWTDACQVCNRDAQGAAQCSLPGIACTPGVPVCRAK